MGFTAEEAKKHGVNVKVGQFPYLANSRAHCVDAKEGLVVVVADETTDIILGMHIMSEHAGEMIAVGSLAIEMKVTAKRLGLFVLHTPHFRSYQRGALAVHNEAIHF